MTQHLNLHSWGSTSPYSGVIKIEKPGLTLVIGQWLYALSCILFPLELCRRPTLFLEDHPANGSVLYKLTLTC